MKAEPFLFFVLGVVLLSSCIKPAISQNRTIRLSENWKIQQSSKVAGGKEISGNNFQPDNWLKAHVPSTIMGILSEQPEYADLFIGENYFKADKAPFNESWWYRTNFTIEMLKSQNTVLLQLDGISYYANVWLNGKLIAGKDEIFGTFRRFELDISGAVIQGENTLAIEVFRPREGDFGLGFVDWNPRPLDENLGVWRNVKVSIIDAVQLKNSFVRSKVNTETLGEAWLTVGTHLKNFSSNEVNGKLVLTLGENKMEIPVSLLANEKKELVLTAKELKGLHLVNPKLWWCSGFGEPNLYQLKFQFIQSKSVISEENISFGIREIESYFNAEAHRGFKLNGKEILIKGAGWSDDIFLRDTEKTNKTQVQYVKDMGLNTIRFETIWGTTQNIYDLCDEYGLLCMVGWSCQWEWDNYLGKPCDNFGGVLTDADIALVTQYARDQVLWLRNHPSIFVWMVGSDMLPRPALEKQYIQLFSELDNRPWLSAASTRTSELTGPTGVKMNGPYEYVGPSYWYVDHKNGGAFGFNTETGPGSQLPVIESIKKMIPENELWPLSKSWDRHCTSGADAMNSMKLLNDIVTSQYGKPTGLNDFVRKGHLVNYEAIRAMMEAFRVNRPNSTGIVQWMLNSAWPSLYWQLYDYYLVPTPAYYGVKKALQPLQLIYNYGDRSVFISNETLERKDNMKACISVFDLNSKLIFEKNIVINAVANGAQKIFDLPVFNALAFMQIELKDSNNKLISDNFYWLSAQSEEFNWEANEWYYTPMKKYSDFTQLSQLPQVNLNTKYAVQQSGDEVILSIEFDNISTEVAFFTELKLKNKHGEWIVPAFFTDNYFSILPGKGRTVEVRFQKGNSTEEIAELSLSGWNVISQSYSVKLN